MRHITCVKCVRIWKTPKWNVLYVSMCTICLINRPLSNLLPLLVNVYYILPTSIPYILTGKLNPLFLVVQYDATFNQYIYLICISFW